MNVSGTDRAGRILLDGRQRIAHQLAIDHGDHLAFVEGAGWHY